MTNISEMTDDQLNEALAIEVRRWHKDRVNPHPSNQLNWYDEVNRYIMPCIYWQPCTDLNQAVECAEFMANLGFSWSIGNVENDHYHAYVFKLSTEAMWYYNTTDTPARALSEAVLMAKRGGG